MMSTWYVYYTEENKVVRQVLVVREDALERAYRKAEAELAGKEIEFIAIVKYPLKLQNGES